MWKKVGLGVAVALVILLGVVATRPADFTVKRSATIPAPPKAVFAMVTDFHRWSQWSPWAKLDPNMKVTFSGAPSGVDAVYAWDGDDKVGAGRMTIENVNVPGQIDMRLEFTRPFAATNHLTFTFVPNGDGTDVTWTMTGHNDFMGKAMSLFMSMDKMVGGDFERGLVSLKSATEASVARAAAAAASATHWVVSPPLPPPSELAAPTPSSPPSASASASASAHK